MRRGLLVATALLPFSVALSAPAAQAGSVPTGQGVRHQAWTSPTSVDRAGPSTSLLPREIGVVPAFTGDVYSTGRSASSSVRPMPRQGPADQGANIYGLPDEVKKVVAACLGLGVVGRTAWKAIGEDVIRQLTHWETAAKFVIRRISVAGAVSCMGGVVCRYI